MILAPIVQVGWRSACCGGDRGELLGRRIEERTARCGQDQARDARSSPRRRGIARSPSAPSRSGGARPAGWRTGRRGRSPRRVAASVAGQRHHEVAARDERLLVGRGHDLPGAQGGQDRPKADDAAGRDDDEVDVVARGERLEGVRAADPCRARGGGPVRRAPSRRRARRHAAAGARPARRAARHWNPPPARRP